MTSKLLTCGTGNQKSKNKFLTEVSNIISPILQVRFSEFKTDSYGCTVGTYSN